MFKYIYIWVCNAFLTDIQKDAVHNFFFQYSKKNLKVEYQYTGARMYKAIMRPYYGHRITAWSPSTKKI